MVSIETQNLTFAYHKEYVLEALSLKFEPGKFSAVLGPNGSGKSTLIKCIDGILPVNSKSIFIDNRDITRLSGNERARLMGYVPQQENAVFSSTVYETVLMGRKPYIGWAPGKTDHKTVNSVIAELDLGNISHRYLNELSGGQRQRAIIGRALAQEPRVLLLDEPTANLDLKHQLEVMQILQELANKNMNVIIAIHDLNLAAMFCNNFVMLQNGALFAEGNSSVITAETIRKLYGVEVKIIADNDKKMIIPEIPDKNFQEVI
jgi:iron complex transport system ATP-binding protein